MSYKFYHLPIDTVFTLPSDLGRFDQYKKISNTRAVYRSYPDEWGDAQFPFRNDIEVLPLNAPPISTWEEFHIEITHETNEQDNALENERAELTEQFESELYRLVQKYQGQAGLKFYARNSESEITEW
jgi:hypothetical protein